MLCMVPGTHSKEELRAQKKGLLPLEPTGELAAVFDILSLVCRAGVRCFVLAHTWAPLAFASSKKNPEVPDTSATPWVFYVRPVVRFHVPYLHKYTILPGCFNTGEITHSSLAPFWKTVELLWQQVWNEKSASHRHSKYFISDGFIWHSHQQRYRTAALSKPALP